MEPSKIVPRGMRREAELDLSSRRAAILLNLVAVLSLVVWAWLFLRLAGWLRPGLQGRLDPFALRAGLSWPAVLGVIVGVLLLHEAVHGLCFWLFTRERPVFGLGLLHAYAAAPDWYLPRNAFLVTGLAPLAVLSLLGVAALPIVPASWVAPLLLGLIVNAGGAVGDLYAVARLLPYPAGTLVRDTGAVMQIYVPAPDPAHELAPRWAALMNRLGVDPDIAEARFAVLRQHYDTNRSYHDLIHVLQLLELLDRFVDRAPDANRDAVELAIWYHDAVYEPGAADNEARSAALLRRSFASVLAPALLDQVDELIQATTHERRPDDPVARLLVDLDLAPLAASPRRFVAQSQSLRHEYAAIPDEVYYPGQAQLFRRLLERPRLYLTDTLAPLESLARRNLLARLAEIENRP